MPRIYPPASGYVADQHARGSGPGQRVPGIDAWTVPPCGFGGGDSTAVLGVGSVFSTQRYLSHFALSVPEGTVSRTPVNVAGFAAASPKQLNVAVGTALCDGHTTLFLSSKSKAM